MDYFDKKGYYELSSASLSDSMITYKKSILRCEASPKQPQSRLNLFKRLMTQFSPNPFVLVGQGTGRFKGSIAAPFKRPSQRPVQHDIKLENNEDSNYSFVDLSQFQLQKDGNGDQKRKEIQVKLQQIKNQTNSGGKGKKIVSELMISNKPYFSQQSHIDVDVSPEKIQQWEGLQIPRINYDGKYYSNLFVFESKKLIDEAYFQNFQKKIQQYEKNIAQKDIYEPRIDSQTKHCWPCQKNYEDYLGHIQSYQHNEAVKKSPAAKHLKLLETSMNVGDKKSQRIKQLRKERRKVEKQNKRDEQKISEMPDKTKEDEQQNKVNTTQKKAKKVDQKKQTSREKLKKQRKVQKSSKISNNSKKKASQSIKQEQSSQSSSSSNSTQSSQQKQMERSRQKQKEKQKVKPVVVKRKRGRPPKRPVT